MTPEPTTIDVEWTRSVARVKASETLAEILADPDSIADSPVQGRQVADATWAGNDEFGPWVAVTFVEGPALMQFILDENNGDGIFELLEHLGQGEDI